MKATISAMNGSDWAQLREQVAHVSALLKKRYGGATLEQTLADVALLQQILDDGVYDATQLDEVRGLGAAFGNVICKQLNFEWVAEDDDRHREPVLRLKTNSKVVINPMRTLVHQMESGDRIDLTGIYKSVQADVKRNSLI